MKFIFFLYGMITLSTLAHPPLWADEKAPQLQASLPIVEGQTMPSFSATDALGQMRQSSPLKGKRALLISFFPKSFTGNCTNQLVSLRDHYAELQKQGVEVWAVSTDSADGPKGQKAFAQHLKLPFPLIPDTSRTLSLLFGAVQTREQMAARMSVFIDKQGIVRSIDKQMNPLTHGTDVLKNLPQWEAAASISPQK